MPFGNTGGIPPIYLRSYVAVDEGFVGLVVPRHVHTCCSISFVFECVMYVFVLSSLL